MRAQNVGSMDRIWAGVCLLLRCSLIFVRSVPSLALAAVVQVAGQEAHGQNTIGPFGIGATVGLFRGSTAAGVEAAAQSASWEDSSEICTGSWQCAH